MSYQILGLPNESLDSMIQTLAFNARLPVLLGASPFYRTPSSPIARGLALSEADFVKARLTALGVKAENFTRDDVYSLFVTTRIVDFLKSLPLDDSADLMELLKMNGSDPRTRIGIELLRRLLETGRLGFWTRQGAVENVRFRPEILARVLSQAAAIGCRGATQIATRTFAQKLDAQILHRGRGAVRQAASALVNSASP